MQAVGDFFRKAVKGEKGGRGGKKHPEETGIPGRNTLKGGNGWYELLILKVSYL